MNNKFLRFKPDNAFNLIENLFDIGIFFLIPPSFFIGKFIAITFPATVKVPSQNPGYFTFTSKPNIFLGFIGSLVSFYLFLILWKITCQLVYIIFRALEKYIESKD
ncbi:hypothetical protein [Tepidibacter hydrothermalis]|uniref:Uncharacterized protein n=1 Tax=Tepidibacter hydrothermalis TaxID=3036126 RepID=A0ABY8E6Z7_9FIRM|nr:hypothetical protein [Tepidibacter hydrothermalis]WFD08661.1 hypothetical protein P4S50_09630 [Tepidibacter hydrothermalis]